MSPRQTVYRVTKHSPLLDGIQNFTEDIPVPSKWDSINTLALNYRDIVVSQWNFTPSPIGKDVVPFSHCAAFIKALGVNVHGFTVGDKVIVFFDGNNFYGPQA